MVHIIEAKPLTKYWIAYTLIEGGKYHMVSCGDRAAADGVIKRFKETGRMENPYYRSQVMMGQDAPEFLEPADVMLVEAKTSLHSIPVVH